MEKHFLVVTYAAQGHVNPALQLCRRLMRTSGARITFSTSVAGHHRMFPTSDGKEVDDGLISYIPFSDGYDNGFNSEVDNRNDFHARSKSVGSETLAAIVRFLEERGRPVTCIVYTLIMPWVGDLARDLGIPSAFYWIQPATVFAIYYHYFHGYDAMFSSQGQDPMYTVNFPGLPPFKFRDLPSFLSITSTDDPMAVVLRLFRDIFEVLDREEASSSTVRVLVNTFEELEADALVAAGKMKLIPIGPMVPSPLLEGAKGADGTGADLFKADEKQYMEWLDTKAEGSVVYVSFGSLAVMKKRQAEEMLRGLKESGRPYLWVVRKENREEVEGTLEEDGEGGMVVEWCSQVRVLSHPAVGCFVTHCGWNSMVESLACGVPTVGVPQWSDQTTNARLAEVWGTGVRAELDGEGLLQGAELRRCLEMVMGVGEQAEQIRSRAEMLKDKAREAVSEGGPSDRNLRAFVEEIASY